MWDLVGEMISKQYLRSVSMRGRTKQILRSSSITVISSPVLLTYISLLFCNDKRLTYSNFITKTNLNTLPNEGSLSKLIANEIRKLTRHKRVKNDIPNAAKTQQHINGFQIKVYSIMASNLNVT